MATLKDLAKRLNKLADSADDYAAEAVAIYALEIVRALLPVTPVDTSQALSNWRVGTGTASPIPPHVPGEDGSTAVASLAQALADAEDAIRAHKGARALVIFNSVPYIRRLNEGHSAQAPAGFIERATLAGRLAARQAWAGRNGRNS